MRAAWLRFASRPRGVTASLPALGVAQLLRLLHPRQLSCGLALSMTVAFAASVGKCGVVAMAKAAPAEKSKIHPTMHTMNPAHRSHRLSGARRERREAAARLPRAI